MKETIDISIMLKRKIESDTESNHILAVIVSFNPDLERLRKNIEGIAPQVGYVCIVDNGSANITDIERLVAEFANAKVIAIGKNLGIASAINIAAKECRKLECYYIFTLDQDSICSKGMINRLLREFSRNKVGLVCPAYFDAKRKVFSSRVPQDQSAGDVDYSITSGSLCSMEAFDDVGGMDENLFVGMVDNDYCLRLIRSGWRIIQVNDTILDHELGVVERSRYDYIWNYLFNKTRCPLFQKLSYKRTISAFRLYHYYRAAIYIRRKYGGSSIEATGIPYMARNLISSLIRSHGDPSVLSAAIRGIREGIKISVKNVQRRGCNDGFSGSGHRYI